jgi:hypothetical protein
LVECAKILGSGEPLALGLSLNAVFPDTDFRYKVLRIGDEKWGRGGEAGMVTGY